MSEAIQILRRMLAQAQRFADETPLEAVARAKTVRKEAVALFAGATGEERAELEEIASIAASRIEQYEQRLAAWQAEVRERAQQFVRNEHAVLDQPIPPKI